MDATLKPTLALMGGRALAFIGTFLIPVVLVRVFDPAGFGTYKQLFLIATTLYFIAQCGMAESLFYFLPGRGRDSGRYVANSLLFLAGAGIACVGALWWASPAGAGLLGNEIPSRFITLTGLFLVLWVASAGLEVVMISRGKHVWAASSYGISDLLRAAFLVLPALLLRSLEAVLVGAAAFAAVRLAAALLYYAAEFRASLRPEPGALRAQLVYALPFGAAVVIEILQTNFHQYAVSYAFDAATFAIYTVGCLNVPLVELVAGPAGNVMMVGMTAAMREGRRADSLALWRQTTRNLTLVFAPLSVLLVLVAPELIGLLFTESYLQSVPVFQVWSAGILLSALMTDAALRVHADTRLLLALNLVRLGVNLALMGAFIQALHLPGAVLVTLLATGLAKALALARMRSLMGASFRELLPWGRLLGIVFAAAAAGALVVLLKQHLGPSALVRLVGSSLLYSALVLLLFARFGLLGDSPGRLLRAASARLSSRSAAPAATNAGRGCGAASRELGVENATRSTLGSRLSTTWTSGIVAPSDDSG